MQCHFRILEELQVVLLPNRQSTPHQSISAEPVPVKQSSMARDIAGIINPARFPAGPTVPDQRETPDILDPAAGISSRMVLGCCTLAICSSLRRKDKIGQGAALGPPPVQAELDLSHQPTLGGQAQSPHPEVPGRPSKGIHTHLSSRCIPLDGARIQIKEEVRQHPALETSSGQSLPRD